MAKKKGRKPNSKIIKDLNSKNISLEHCYIAHLPITVEDIKKFNNKQEKQIDIQENKLDTNIKFNINNQKKIKLEISKKGTLKSTLQNSNDNKLDNDKLDNDKLDKEIPNRIYNYGSIKFKNNIKTSLCWWCCHSFDNDPIYLPEYIDENNIYNVYGCFCSFNCSLAYNFDLKDNKIWERTNYLNKLYFDIYKRYTKICCAPSKYILESFGGNTTIEDFRKKFLVNNNYRLIIPPFEGLVPSIEINNIEHINSNKNNLNYLKKKNKIIKKDVNNMGNIMNLQFN